MTTAPDRPYAPPTTVSVSRGRRTDAYHLLTPANQFPSRLPGFDGVIVKKLATPRLHCSRFGWYLLEVEPGGGTSAVTGAEYEHFLLGLDGAAHVLAGSAKHGLADQGFAFLPTGTGFELRNDTATPARLLWIKQEHQPWPGVPTPEPVSGKLGDAEYRPGSVAGISRAELLPVDAPYDFSMSVLSFEPGAVFPKVEVHDEEHGLWMLKGSGLYHLDGDIMEVETEDFIHMAPYCPQYFYPTGPGTAAYLLYKDINRDGF
jgi:(S)-ureidoglycine aminohydrolase